MSHGTVPGKRIRLRYLLVLFLLTVAAYSPVRHADYIQDDHLAVEENSIVQDGDVVEIFSSHYWEGASGADSSLYRPVTILSYALERGFTATPSARVSHAVNVLLHILAALMLGFAAIRSGFSPTAAMAACLLFAVHPIHTESVAGVVGRAEILSGLFAFLAIWAFSGRSRVMIWLAALCLFLALGSKESAIALIPLLVYLQWRNRDRFLEAANRMAPLLLAFVLHMILRIQALQALLAVQSPHPLDNPLVAVEGGVRLFTGLGLLARYVFLLFAPFRLSADYSGTVIPMENSLLSVLPLAGAVLLALLLAGAALPLFSRRPAGSLTHQLALASLMFLLPYLVIGNLLVQIGTIFAERLLYLPSAGFCLLAGIFLTELPAWAPPATGKQLLRKFNLAGVVILLLSAGYAMGTYARCTAWQNDESLFNAVLDVYPDSPRSNFIVAKIVADRVFEEGRGLPRNQLLGGLERPVSLLDHAVGVVPSYSVAWNEKGLIEARLGNNVEAIRLFRKTLEISPRFPRARLNLAIALGLAGRKPEALRSVRKAILDAPDAHKPWAQLGHLLVDTGRPREAVEAYRRAVDLGREDLLPRLQNLERSLN
ncbi:MAG: tetratricopeptide repeat protein [Acidobacteria bacterium]|uniref:Tetratricopeptide repeat protein n=1 Tax=Candidatus Polarisedimenticola svalbardensis TaxID=2886004 RepID=A0A8J6XYS7_9BACT|nr:tetratricopeptide repeat protein [Candidatus Polarisedimenticola svalbardensis]